MARNRLSLRLSYQKDTCVNCGDQERIIATPCATCGHQPRRDEVNSHVAERRRLARVASERLDPLVTSQARRSPTVEHSMSADVARNYIESLSATFSGLLDSLQRASRHPTDESIPLCKAIDDLVGLYADLYDFVPLRPGIFWLRTLKQAVEHVGAMTRHYLRSFESPTPLLAQESGASAQREIDATAELMGSISSKVDVVLELQRGNIMDEGGTNLLDAIQLLAPGRTILEADESSRSRLKERFANAPAAPGSGLTYMLMRSIADQFMDRDAFEAKLTSAVMLITNATPDQRAILSDAEFQRDLSRGQTVAYEAHVILDRALRPGLPESTTLRQLMKYYAEIFESLGGPLLVAALRLAGAKTASFSNMIKKDVAEHVESCRSMPSLSSLAGGFDKTLRHAASHSGGYRIEADEIIIELRSHSGSISSAAMIDRLAELLESCQAMALAIQMFDTGSEGLNLSQLGFSAAQQATYILRSCGQTVQFVEQVGSTWTARITNTSSSLLLLCRAISGTAPEDCSSVKVQAEDRWVSADSSSMRESQAWDLDDALTVVRLLASARQPGGQCLTSNRLRRIAATTVARQLEGELPKSIPSLKGLRGYANAIGDADLARALTATMRLHRLGVTEIAGTEAAQDFSLLTRIPSQGPPDIP